MRVTLKIEDELSSLDRLDLNALRRLWSHHFGPPPKLRSVELLRLCIAWRLQAKVHGGLDVKVRQSLERHTPVQPEGRELGLGAILRRHWQGRTIEVIVEAEGFRYEGMLYPSLSAIAETVTGTRWNGPRFFGLRKAAA